MTNYRLSSTELEALLDNLSPGLVYDMFEFALSHGMLAAMALSLQRYTCAEQNSRFTQLLKERSREQKERSMAIRIETAVHLPESLIIEVLSWLPVKELLQCKSVNKTWHAIISSPYFISKHLKNNYHRGNNQVWNGCLLIQRYVAQAELQVFELFLDRAPRVLADEVLYGVSAIILQHILH